MLDINYVVLLLLCSVVQCWYNPATLISGSSVLTLYYTRTLPLYYTRTLPLYYTRTLPLYYTRTLPL